MISVGFVGTRFGRLVVVVDPVWDMVAGKKVRVCVVACDCGNTITITMRALRDNKTHCGCRTRRKLPNLTNMRFGRLTVLAVGTNLRGIKGRRVKVYQCRCDCGKEKLVEPSSLIDGRTKSCGCILAEINAARFRKHGWARTAEYTSWHLMKNRCYNNNFKHWNRYGGRGISVCARWLDPDHGFENFIADMGQKPSRKHTLDRIDNNGNYEPSNCRWATRRTQAANRNVAWHIELGGRTYTPYELTDITGIPAHTIKHRIKAGYSIASALAFSIATSMERGGTIKRKTIPRGQRTMGEVVIVASTSPITDD